MLPPPIPGIRVAYIGHTTSTLQHMQAYWQARGAAFQQLILPGEPAAGSLDRLLEWADIVLRSEDGISASIRRRIEAYCDRAEKPLIPVDLHRVSGLAEALVTWCPLA